MKKQEASKNRKQIFRITPGLFHKVQEFVAHYETGEDEPILIVGETGTGKSLFLYLYEQLYKTTNHEINRKNPVIWANCAHFGGKQSDPNIARSELFGCRKGAHALAVSDVKGLVEKANDGILILEEIGELPEEVQAMLLTFIETGEYRRVGDTEQKNSNLRIVGATNNEGNLRADFRYRCFPFRVPPLRERRKDVLYHLWIRFPEMIPGLSRWEVLLLLSYNWNGNVRELERVGRLLTRNKIAESKAESSSAVRFLFMDSEVTALSGNHVTSLHRRLKDSEVDVQSLERLLNKYGVGFRRDERPAFPGFEILDLSKLHLSDLDAYTDDLTKCLSDLRNGAGKKRNTRITPKNIYKILGISLIPTFPQFENAYEGLRIYCSLFKQSETGEHNLLDIQKSDDSHPEMKYIEGKKRWEGYIRLRQQIEDFLHRETLTPERQKVGDLSAYSYEELLELYYGQLLSKTNNNIRAAAQLADVNEKTFYARIKKAGFIRAPTRNH